jgi:serine/threonine-protein kinase
MSTALSPNIKLIGRYPILRELRRDRHTVVYLALDPVLNRELLVKAVQLRPTKPEERAAMARVEQAFMRQAQAAGRLHHPHIVTVFDGGLVNNIGYLALEKVEGKLLEDLLVEGYRPGALQSADIAARVADAIEFAHARGIPHGHLSPSRIFLQNADHMPKVMGFGGWIDSGATGDFELQGTASMLPYFGNELGADARRKDVRALGALLFLLLTGARPDAKTLRKQPSRGESPILQISPNAPQPLAEIAEDALELRGVRPYGSAAQVRNALTTFLWGSRGAEAPPHAATITGMPARLSVVPDARPARSAGPRPDAVAAVAAFTDRPNESPSRRRLVQLQRYGLAAVGLCALLAFGTLWWSPARTGHELPAEAAAKSSSRPVAGVRFSSTTGTPPRVAERAPGSGPGAEGTVTLAVAPWGEIYVNGDSYGRSPPLTQLSLPVGRHTIEVRNGEAAAYVAQVDVSVEQTKHIRHRFQ